MIVTIIGACKYEEEMKQIAHNYIKHGIACFFPTRINNVNEDELKYIFSAYRTMMKMSDYILLYNKNGFISKNTLIDLKYALENRFTVYSICPVGYDYFADLQSDKVNLDLVGEVNDLRLQ